MTESGLRTAVRRSFGGSVPAGPRRARRWRRWVGVSVALILAWLAFLSSSIATYAGRSDGDPADAAVVLGAAVAGDTPTPVFEQRIRHAIDLYNAHAVRALVLTGGFGAGDVLAESEAARRYCLAHGVPDEAISIETRSHSTRGNLVEARALLTARGLRRVLIVSDPLHERRAVTIARDVGLDAYPSPTPTSRYVGLVSRGRFLARETYFYARYLIARALGVRDGV